MQKISRRKRGDENQAMEKVTEEVLYREGDMGGIEEEEEEEVSSQQDEVQRRQRGGEKHEMCSRRGGEKEVSAQRG